MEKLSDLEMQALQRAVENELKFAKEAKDLNETISIAGKKIKKMEIMSIYTNNLESAYRKVRKNNAVG